MAGMHTGRIHRFAVLATLALAACSSGGNEDPAAVLEKAAAKAQQLQSAAFNANFSYDAQPMSIGGTADGTLADGGKRMSFAFSVDTTIRGTGADRTVSAKGDVVVAGENEAYVRLDRVDGSILYLPGIGLVPEEALHRWIRTGQGIATADDDLTPDPAMIARQTRTLDVVRDRSYQTIDGRKCFVFDVTIDHDRMLAFLEETARTRGESFDRAAAETFLSSYESEGVAYIDASTYVIRRIDWTFSAAPGQPDMEGSFSIRLRDHDAPVEITPPSDAASLDDVLPDTTLPAL